jgi:type III secretion protein V
LSAEHYLRAVRTKLNREITYRYADHPTPGVAPSLPVYLLDPEIERRVNAMDKKPLTNAERLQLVRALLSDVGTGQAVVLTTEDVRGAFWSLVHPELPDLTVLAYQDLSPHCTIKPLARITLNHQA